MGEVVDSGGMAERHQLGNGLIRIGRLEERKLLPIKNQYKNITV